MGSISIDPIIKQILKINIITRGIEDEEVLEAVPNVNYVNAIIFPLDIHSEYFVLHDILSLLLNKSYCQLDDTSEYLSQINFKKLADL